MQDYTPDSCRPKTIERGAFRSGDKAARII